MKNIAISAVVVGSLFGGALAGCIFADGGGGSTTSLVCDIICDCLEPTDDTCPASCATNIDIPPGTACPQCIMAHRNSCSTLVSDCDAVCDSNPPPPMNTVSDACQNVCNCFGSTDPACQMCASALGGATQSCIDCFTDSSCNTVTTGGCDALCQ